MIGRSFQYYYHLRSIPLIINTELEDLRYIKVKKKSDGKYSKGESRYSTKNDDELMTTQEVPSVLEAHRHYETQLKYH